MQFQSQTSEIPVPSAGSVRIYYSSSSTTAPRSDSFPTVSAPTKFGCNNLLPLILAGREKSLQRFVLAQVFPRFSVSRSALQLNSKRFAEAGSHPGAAHGHSLVPKTALSARDVSAKSQPWEKLHPTSMGEQLHTRAAGKGRLSPALPPRPVPCQ